MLLKITDDIPFGQFDYFDVYINEKKYYLKRKSFIQIEIFDDIDDKITIYTKVHGIKSKEYVFDTKGKEKLFLVLSHDSEGFTNRILFTIIPPLIFFIIKDKLEFLTDNDMIYIALIYIIYEIFMGMLLLAKTFSFDEISFE